MEVTVPDYQIVSRVSVAAPQAAVLIADMLVDFVSPRGKLFVPETRKTIEPLRLLIGRARQGGAAIVYIQDWHRPDDPEFSIWGTHAVQESPGSRIIRELAPAKGDYLIRKRTYDPFFATDLDLLLRQKNIRDLIVTGTVANICVLHTTSSAALRGYRVIVPVDTISALHPFDFQSALRQIHFVYRGILTRSQGIHFKSGKAPRRTR